MGSKDLAKQGAARSKYLSAIRRADAGVYEELVAFARS